LPRKSSILGSLKKAAEAELGGLEGGDASLASGNILDREEDEVRMSAIRGKATGVESHAFLADRGKIVLDLEIVYGHSSGNGFFEQDSQVGNVPLTVAEFIDVASERLVSAGVKFLVESGVSRQDSEVFVEDQESFSERRDDFLGVVECVLEGLFVTAAFGAVAEDEDDPSEFAGLVPDRCGGVLDGPLGTVLGDEQAVIGEADDRSVAQGTHGGVLGRLEGLFVDDTVDGFERGVGRLGLCPAGKGLGGWVQEDDTAGEVAGDDGIDDARERDVEPLDLFE
jgi:hypothetical protein